MHQPAVDLDWSDEALAREAWLFCGEGCVSISKAGTTHQLYVLLGNSDPALLDPFIRRWGGSYYEVAEREGIQASATWTVTGARAVEVCRAYAPFAIGRKQQALLLGVRFGALLGSRGTRLTDERRDARRALAAELRKITDPNGVRSRVGNRGANRGQRRAA